MFKQITKTIDLRGVDKLIVNQRIVITSVIMEDANDPQVVTAYLTAIEDIDLFSLPTIAGRYIINDVAIPKGGLLRVNRPGIAFIICDEMRPT